MSRLHESVDEISHITHLLCVKIAFLGCPTSRWLAASLLTRLAGGDSGVAVWRLPTYDRVPRGSPADAPPARPSARCSRWHCSGGRCCNAPHGPRPDAVHLPATAGFPAECTRFSAICASVQSCRSTVDNKARFGHASCPRCE